MLLYLRELYNPEGIVDLMGVISKGVKIFEILIQKGIEKGELRQIDLNLASWYLMGVFNVFDLKFVNHGTLPLKEEIESVVELALEGIKIK